MDGENNEKQTLYEQMGWFGGVKNFPLFLVQHPNLQNTHGKLAMEIHRFPPATQTTGWKWRLATWEPTGGSPTGESIMDREAGCGGGRLLGVC